MIIIKLNNNLKHIPQKIKKNQDTLKINISVINVWEQEFENVLRSSLSTVDQPKINTLNFYVNA